MHACVDMPVSVSLSLITDFSELNI